MSIIIIVCIIFIILIIIFSVIFFVYKKKYNKPKKTQLPEVTKNTVTQENKPDYNPDDDIILF